MYIFIFLLILSIFLLRDRVPVKMMRLIVIISIAAIIVLRYGVGGDYFSYQLIYDSVDPSNVFVSISNQPEIEPLFIFIISLFKLVRLPYHIFLISMNAIMFYFTIKLINEHSPNESFSYFVYFSMSFLFWNLGAIRQGLVIAGLLYFYFKKDFPVYLKIIATIVFSMIHISALVIPVVYLLSKLNWKKSYFIVILFLIPIFKALNPLMVDFISKLPMLGRFSKYLAYDAISLVSFPSLLRIFMVAAIIIFYDFLMNEFQQNKTLIKFTLLNLLMYFFIPGSMVMGTRLTVFGYYLMLLVFPMILSSISFSKMTKWVTVGLVLFCTGVYTNELLKQVDRTGYENGLIAFNVETIFNGDINRFSNQRAIMKNVKMRGIKNIKNETAYQNAIDGKYYKVDANEQDVLVPVLFNKTKLYGVINTKGEVIIEPNFENRPAIYDQYLETAEWINSFQRRTYYDSITGFPVEYEEIRSAIVTTVMGEVDLLSNPLIETMLFPSEVEKVPLPFDLKLKSVVQFSRIEQTGDSRFTYYKIATKSYSFFIVVNEDNELLNNQIYESIQPFNGKDYMIGTVDGYKEYVNSNGETIWVE